MPGVEVEDLRQDIAQVSVVGIDVQPQCPVENGRVGMVDKIEDGDEGGKERQGLHKLEERNQPQQSSTMSCARHGRSVSCAGKKRTPEASSPRALQGGKTPHALDPRHRSSTKSAVDE